MTTKTEDEQDKVMRKSKWLHDRRCLRKMKDIIVYSACIIKNKRNIMSLIIDFFDDIIKLAESHTMSTTPKYELVQKNNKMRKKQHKECVYFDRCL